MTGDRLTVGVVTPHAAPGLEVELPAMSPGRLEVLLARTAAATSAPGHADLREAAEDAALDRAAAALAGARLDAVAHASTTTAYVVGRRAEADLAERLAVRFAVPVVTTGAAAVAALRVSDLERVQLVHPPWFDAELDELGAAYFGGEGFEVTVTRATELPDDPARVSTDDVVDRVAELTEDRAEALFLAGNGFRAAAAVEEMERRTGRLVVAANQALWWGVLGATGRPWTLPGHGRLLQTPAPDPACWDAC